MPLFSNKTTFKVHDKKAEKHSERCSTLSGPEIVQKLEAYKEFNCSEVLQSSSIPKGAFSSKYGFVHTVIECYNNHHNLVIRPDDVWAAIMTQFSFYLNDNAEEFRNKFVNFEGKKELTVAIEGNLRSAPYDLFVKLMTKKIDENLVDPEVKKWILPNFSTTTDTDLVSIGVIFMATMKNYFNYTCMVFCGIPYITLEGSVDDWKDIHKRLEKLKDCNLEKWYSMLEPILQQFINVKKGKIELDFWQKICHYQNNDSGGDICSGWITAFCMFNKKGEWMESPIIPIMTTGMSVERMAPGIVTVDVKIESCGAEYKSTMFAGHMATQVLKDGYSLTPVLGWAIALNPDEAEAKDAVATLSSQAEPEDRTEKSKRRSLLSMLGLGQTGQYNFQ